MKSYEIDINIGRLLHYSEVLKPQINNETLLMIIKSFSTYMKQVYLTTVYDNIYNSRYKGDWEPVEDEAYLKFLGTTPSTPMIELIYDALEVRVMKNHIIVRIDPRYKYPGSKLTLLRVIDAIDTGTTKFNARPIFKQILRYVRSNLIQFWKLYLKKKGVA